MKIVFMGSPDFAIPTFQKIKHYITHVYTQSPKQKNRGHKIEKTPIHLLAEKENIPVFHPKSLKEIEIPECDFIIVVAYGLILPKHVLEKPKYGCINVHASLLPKWRGAAPIQYAILSGDIQTGVTIMKMDEGMDSGDILSQKNISITEQTNYTSLYEDLSQMGAELLYETLNHMPPPIKQNEEQVTYAPKITKTDGIIDLNDSANHILRKIKALNPWPGTYLSDYDIKILEASKGPHTTHKPGVFFDKIYLSCGNGESLKLSLLQRKGGKPLNSKDFMNGFQQHIKN